MSFPDFSASDAQIQWQRFCDLSWYHDDLGVWLDISRMHVNAADLQQLQPRMDKAFTAMQELEAGAIANPDEQRQVGHYWLRNPDLAPDRSVGEHISERFTVGSLDRSIDHVTPKGSNQVDFPGNMLLYL